MNEVLVKKEAETSPKFGCPPSERTADEIINYGIVNIDKPRGPTSHQISHFVKKILGIKKAGHSGTLDPHVTGVLPVALGRGTKVVQLILPAGKEYIALMHLHKNVPQDTLLAVIDKFNGEIEQIPPVRSAVKRQKRKRHIYSLDLLEIEGKDVLFQVSCEAGTYIRKLISDIGTHTGGAHMAELRRIRAGPFDESTLCTLQDLTDAVHYYKEGNDKYLKKLIHPIENGIGEMKKVWVIDSAVDTICHGASLKLPGIAKLEAGIQIDEKVAIMTLKDELVAYGVSLKESAQMMAEKGIAVKSSRVFMNTGVYPKIEIN